MTLLRIFCPLSAVPTQCRWVLFDDATGVHPGAGTLTQLPQDAARVELMLAASQVLIVRTPLPPASGRKSAALLAYAAEEKLASDPETNAVSRLGPIGGDAVLAVVGSDCKAGVTHSVPPAFMSTACIAKHCCCHCTLVSGASRGMGRKAMCALASLKVA